MLTALSPAWVALPTSSLLLRIFRLSLAIRLTTRHLLPTTQVRPRRQIWARIRVTSTVQGYPKETSIAVALQLGSRSTLRRAPGLRLDFIPCYPRAMLSCPVHFL